MEAAPREPIRVRTDLLEAEIDPLGGNIVRLVLNKYPAGSEESALHLRVAVMRSIELRRDMVRAVNFGPTTWVDAVGRIRGRRDPPDACRCRGTY